MAGTVKFFHQSMGYGFIARPGGDDVFVHHSNIVSKGVKTLDEGMTVRFDIGAGRKGPQAVNVKVG